MKKMAQQKSELRILNFGSWRPPCVEHLRKSSPNTTIEILTPDFLKKEGAIEIVVKAKPDAPLV